QIDVRQQGRNHRTLRCPSYRRYSPTFLPHPCPQPLVDQPQYPFITNAMLQETAQPRVIDRVEERADVRIQHPMDRSIRERHPQRIQCVMLTSTGTKSITEPNEVRLVHRAQYLAHGVLDDLIFKGRYPKRSLRAVALRYE